MINKLTRIIVGVDGELQTSRLPNNEEMMNKINEIIEYVNEHQTQYKRLAEKEEGERVRNLFKSK